MPTIRKKENRFDGGMENVGIRHVAIFLSVQLISFSSSAGLVPLKLVRGRAAPYSKSVLVARADTVEYTLLADRIEAAEVLDVEAGPSPANVFLGIPLPVSRWSGCQDVVITVAKGGKVSKAKTRIVHAMKQHAGKPDVARWLLFPLRLSAYERAQVSVTWWQAYSQIDLYGYPRIEFEDPLWTVGYFNGLVSKIVRRVRLTQGIKWTQSSPNAELVPTSHDGGLVGETRVLSFSDASPEPTSVFKVTLNRTLGALSACTDADPWSAVDGSARTSFLPVGCSPEHSFIDLLSDCKGFGTGSPECNEAGALTWDLGMSIRTRDGEAHDKFVVEGYWGRKRVWKKVGRRNEPVPIGRMDHLTRYRVMFPHGFPSDGLGEISLVRFDPKLSAPGFQNILRSKRWHRMGKRCLLLFELRNPAPLRHATLALKPHSRTDAYMLNMDCTDGRKREPFNEPIEHHHSAAELRAMGIDPHSLPSEHHGHFKRKRPWRIELPLDPKCLAYRFRLQAPPMLCSKRFHALVPHVILEY